MRRRERILSALALKVPDRPPISFGVGPGAEDSNIGQVYRHYGAKDKNDLYAKAGIDGFNVWAWNAIMGKYTGSSGKGPDGSELDFWGNSSQHCHGLAACDTVAGLQKHRWPKVEDFDFSFVYDKALDIQAKDMAVAAGHLGLGYQMHNMLRGNEKALYDLCDEKYVQCYVEYVTDFAVKYIDALLTAGKGKIDIVRADEDLGTMERLMISPRMWRKFYKPAWAKAFETVHKHGAKIWFHSCGYIMPLMEDLIDIGIDCWNPFPPNVKDNDHEKLNEYRKGRISLDGGVSHPVLVGGTVEEVKDATKKVLDTFAGDGGLLIGPAQVFTSDIPAENIIAFFETVLNY